jgi:hypothetical protein
MKKTLYDANIKFVRPYLTDGIMLDINYKRAIKNFHSAAVAASICKNGPNPVLGRYLYSNEPRAAEQDLPRKTRCTLRQLRCGKSIRLITHCQTYKHFIGKADDAICPLCQSADHTTRHLFEFAAYPTNLQVDDLWSRPLDAVAFLNLLPTFAHLPPVVHPPPPILPEPPP